MKRTTFLIISVVIVLILVVVWVYLLFFGSANEGDGTVFSNFNFGEDTAVETPTDNTGQVADVTVDTASQERLRQLTTVPVLAYREISGSSTTPPMIYYIEAGTGHLYSINYDNGETKRLSATTIPVASAAALSPNGQHMLIRSGDGFGTEFVVGTLATSSEKIDTTTINESIVDFVIPNNNEILYGVQLPDSYVGKRYSLTTGNTSTLFTVPFREAAVVWGDSSDDTHYVYPKATHQLEGFLYQITNGTLRRLPIDGYGLSATAKNDVILYSQVITTNQERLYASAIYNKTTETETGEIAMIPEKCTWLADTTLVCAAPFVLENTPNLPDSWYQGVVSTADSLWQINTSDLTGLNSRNTVAISSLAGRDIDAINLVGNLESTRVYFQHRHNQLLWVYELYE